MLYILMCSFHKHITVFVFKVKVLLGHRVIQVACGSRDAQTLALTDEGKMCNLGSLRKNP